MQQRSTSELNGLLHCNYSALDVSVENKDIQNILVLVLLLKTA